MATELQLTTGEAANLAGVGPSTVKRWAERWPLPCLRAARSRAREDDMKPLASMLLCLVGAGCATTTTARLHLPAAADGRARRSQRYLGTWYEIANFPQSFQRGCTATTATYTLRDDGEIDVVNRCRKGSLDGPEKVARGPRARGGRATNAKLEVSFFRPFWGDYWIIDLGADYEYAVVGHPAATTCGS